MLVTDLLERSARRSAKGPTGAEVRRYARGLVESYGSHALHYADDMIRAYIANGDAGATAVWRDVRAELLLLLDMDNAAA